MFIDGKARTRGRQHDSGEAERSARKPRIEAAGEAEADQRVAAAVQKLGGKSPRPGGAGAGTGHADARATT